MLSESRIEQKKKHSPEPWKTAIEHSGSGDFETRVEDANGNLVCDLWDNGNNAVDARRIVACVNACAEALQVTLESGLSYEGMRKYIKELEAKLAAIEAQERALSYDDENNYALKHITDGQVELVCRAFWRRIDTYKNDYERELPRPLPVEFMAHMATALTFVDAPIKPDPEFFNKIDAVKS